MDSTSKTTKTVTTKTTKTSVPTSRPVVIRQARASTVGLETNSTLYSYTNNGFEDSDDDGTSPTSPTIANQRISKLFQQPKLDLQIRANKRLDLRLNSIDRSYCTTLAKLTADANERLAVVKDTDILKSEATAEELVALQMLEEWQKTKSRREHRTQLLLTQIQDKISRSISSR